MLQRVLVANRGVIACRIIRTLRRMGVSSVAVYSEADRHAPHVALADQAVGIGAPPAAASYLNQRAILEAATATGAEAIHPGYGFLSENAEFAAACEREGVVFLGPTPAQMRALGLKHSAREIAARKGVPLLPGTGLLADARMALEEAERCGYPIILKSTAGGGGIGMRVCRDAQELTEHYAAVARLGVANFGEAGVYLERYVEHARHIEVQLFGDGRGHVIALGERDCSAQRRNQKVVEETPAPGLRDDVRRRLWETAERLASAIAYRSAGTAEFLYDSDRGEFYFLEVNTRLQVEHPVSEETSGIDLVRQQFRIADGLELEITEDPEPRGHSIEFRINAEDAGRNFMPAPGPVERLEIPQGPGVRWDSGVETGGEVAGAFDSMLAKLIVTGATREEALDRSRRALAEFNVEGLATVIPFHRAVVSDPAFIGDDNGFTVHTRWIETEWDNSVEPFTAGVPLDEEDSLPRQTVVVEIGGRRVEVSLPGDLAIGGGGGAAAAGVIRKKPKARKRGAQGGAAASGDAVTAPMQGTVVKVAVEEGQQVSTGDLVAVLEAMKMENPVTAHKDGTITGLAVEAGAAVTQGTVLAEIKD
jgi:acetyl-CoA/propionyl-CoA carboxylase biotin carboxyl carrier protein